MFTEAQKRAWDYMRSAVETGLKASEALYQYREGGGAIRTQDWYRAYNTYKEYGDVWERISRYSPTETIPDDFWQPAPRNFQRNYVVEVEIAKRNTFTGELERTFRYIESDYRISQSEIQDAIEELGVSYIEEERWTAEYIYGYKFYQSGEVI